MAVLCQLSYSSGNRAMIEAQTMTRPAILALATLILAGCAGTAPPVEDLPVGTLHIDAADGEVRIEVSIAETSEAKQRGLMGVPEMAEDTGMVFLEEEPVQTPFYMKDTLIPLSIAFWDQDGRIRAMLDMEPCVTDTCELYYPEVDWVGAVEVNQGFFAENGVAVGDQVRLQR
jgi:uncharacterized membrane protein (UPF0127 family)